MVELDTMTPQVAVLGSLLLEPALIGETMTKIRAEDFRNERCRLIYQAITGLFLEGKPVDPAIVCGRLGGFDSIGKDLLAIMEQTPTAANIWEYVKLLKEQSTLATLRDIGMRLQETMHLEDALTLVEKANAITSSRPGLERLSAKDMVLDFMDRHGEGKHPDYYTWSIRKLDDKLYTERGDMILIGGYPSAGKTALALRFAWHMAVTRRVGFYSLETKHTKLADRSMATLAGIDMGAIKRSAMTQDDWKKVAAHAEDISKCSMDMIPAGGMTVQDIKADALANRYEVVFLDYLQLISAPHAYTRTEAVTSISIGLHQMAQGNNITVVALSQLKRAGTSKDGEEVAPTMSSLRESGQLEQDADTIMLLYRKDPDDADSQRELCVAKNKEGTIGRITLDFDGSTQTFSESNSSHEVATVYSDMGRKAKNAAKSHAEPANAQMEFTELTGDNYKLPF